MDRSTLIRRLLVGLFLGHAALLATLIRTTGLELPRDSMLAGLFVLNVAGIAGLASRNRTGWFLALLFVTAAVGRYAFTLGLDTTSGFLVLVGIAAAVLCITDPGLRREHGIVA